MKRGFLSLVFLSLLQMSFAQTDAALPTVDSVFLKTGKIYTGQIQKYEDGKFVQILIEDGEQLIIGDIEIARIVQHNTTEVALEEAVDSTTETPLFQVDETLIDEDWEKERDTLPKDRGIVDEVHLKDGSIIRGKIVELKKGESLTLQLNNGRTLVLMEDEIEKIQQVFVQEQLSRKTTKERKEAQYAFREKGIYKVVNMESLNGRLDSRYQAGIGVQVVAGYQLRRELGFGVGVGVNSFSLRLGEVAFPVFAEVRGYFTRKHVAPFYSIQGGYGFVAKDRSRNITEAKGGTFLHPAFGMRIGATSAVNILMDIGYKFQQANFVREYGSGQREIKDINYRRLTIRFGLVF